MMTDYKLIISPKAEAEVIHAAAWYEAKQAGLGDRFIDVFESIVLKIQNAPKIFGYGKDPFREARMPKFPFTLVYLLSSEESLIYLLAVHHNSRNPDHKYKAWE